MMRHEQKRNDLSELQVRVASRRVYPRRDKPGGSLYRLEIRFKPFLNREQMASVIFD